MHFACFFICCLHLVYCIMKHESRLWSKCKNNVIVTGWPKTFLLVNQINMESQNTESHNTKLHNTELQSSLEFGGRNKIIK